MTTVNMKLYKPSENGPVAAAGIEIEFKPTLWHQYYPDGDIAGMMLPQEFVIELDENGEATVELEPTNLPIWCWRVREKTASGTVYYVEVPTSETVLDFVNLTLIDPNTLEPQQYPSTSIALNDLMDVDTNGVTNGMALVYYDPENTGNGFWVGEDTLWNGGTINGDLTVTGKLDGHKVVTVYNQTGNTLTKGTVVYVSSANGDNVLVSKAIATGDSTSANTIGVVYQDIPHNNWGPILTEGYIEGINTAAAGAAGDPIYLSPTVAGGMVFGVANKPSAPNHLVYLGVVARKNANNGRAFIKIQNGYEIEELHNVAISNPANNAILAYNSATGLWEDTTNYAQLNVTNTFTADQIIEGNASNDVTLIVKGAPAQTANLLELKDNANVVRLSTNVNGYTTTNNLQSEGVRLGTTVTYTTGRNHISIGNTSQVPSTVSNGGILYVENGALKYRGSSGTVTTIAPA